MALDRQPQGGPWGVSTLKKKTPRQMRGGEKGQKVRARIIMEAGQGGEVFETRQNGPQGSENPEGKNSGKKKRGQGKQEKPRRCEWKTWEKLGRNRGEPFYK